MNSSAGSIPARGHGASDWIPVGIALAASLVLVWLITHQPLLAVGYGGALLVLGALVAVLARRRAPAPQAELASPDWSVTVAAIERPDTAVAVTDRAGRLVCASRSHEDWFGIDGAPPRLAIDDPSRERLVQAMRDAWRDGSAAAEPLEAAEGGAGFSATIERAGRGEDFLVWRFTRSEPADPVAELARLLEGSLGRLLADGGFAAALVGANGRILAADPAFAERATGDARGLLAGRNFASLLRREDRHLAWATQEGRGRPLTMYRMEVAAREDQPASEPATLVMLAERRPGEETAGEARAATAKFDVLLGQLPLGFAMADRDGRLLYANPAFLRAAGREGSEPPVYPTDLVATEDKAALSAAVRRYAQGHAGPGEITVRLAARPDEPVSLSLAVIRGLGEAAVLLGLTDTAEEIRLKRQMAQATKMQAVGQLAGGIAHDFNNVLTAILGTCDLMLMRHMAGDSDYDDIQQIRACSNRAASLTRQLLAFSRQQTLRPEVLQLPDVVSDTTQMLKRLIGETVELTVTHDRALKPVLADPTGLGQVIVNLVVNARDAIQSRGDGRGRVSLATRPVSAAEVSAKGSEIMPEGEYSALVVEDDGGGIAPEDLAKIYEPFFTTKEQGKGTGLGLSTVYGFVKQSGGFVFADSEPGRGTRFSVYLPVHTGPALAALPAARPPPSAWAGEGSILLVEDEDPVRLVAERALARQGYVVTTARDGEEGLELVRAGASFDLVVSDVVMPVMDGPAMVREIRTLAPELPVLFTSGYAEEQLRKEIDLPNVHFIAKPFSVQQISDKVGEVLRGGEVSKPAR